MPHYICVTCGVQFAETAAPPECALLVAARGGGQTQPVGDGLALIRCGGRFDGAESPNHQITKSFNCHGSAR